MKDDKSLRDELLRQVAIIKKLPRTVQREVEFAMFEDYGVETETTIDIFNGLIRIEILDYSVLYKLMNSIKKVSLKRPEEINSSKLDEDIYFYDLEKIEYSKPLLKAGSDFDIVIKSGEWHRTNVFPYDYITIHTDIIEVEKWDKYNKLRFNPETQRDLVVIKSKGIPVVKLDLNEAAIKSMEKDMINYMYFPVQGTININPEINTQTLLFKNGDLIIPQEIKMDLIEGFHNYTAEIRAKRKKENWNFPCEFRIMFLNTENANRFIKQMDKKNHFSKEQLSRMDTNDPITYIITQLNTSSRFRLKGTIENEIVPFLYDIISKFYTFKNDNDKFDTFDIIQDNLNYIVATQKINNPLNKEEWNIYLYLIHKNITNPFDLKDVLLSKSFINFLNEIKINKKLSIKQLKELDDIIGEVKNNV